MHSKNFANSNKSKFIVILGFGFFSISVQSILFRDFLDIYQGTELVMGFFFSAWFLWIAVGAFTGKLLKNSSSLLQNNFELLLLIYIPAYILEYIVIQNTRTICGIPSYELFPLFKMVPASFFALAPVSFCTGLFFSMACRWIAVQNTGRLPVASVYIAEVGGGCAGGIFVTVSLSSSIPQENVFLYSALLLCISVFIHRLLLLKAGKLLINILLCGLVILIISGITGNTITGIWTKNVHKNQWSRLLPAENYHGSFYTSQGLYHFGEYKGMFAVISGGTVCENYPDPLYGAEIAALHLVQNPSAHKILVIGQGALPVCREFLRFPQIQQVVWAAPDPAYTSELIKALPARYKDDIKRLTIHKGDIEDLLIKDNTIFNLVIIHLPDPTTLVLNKFFTREFYLDIKQHTPIDGILSILTQGGENYLGGELVQVGASVFETLKSTFRNVIIKPGDQSWLLASDSEQLSGSPFLLKKRYEEFQLAENIFPVQGLDLLYQEDRALFQQEKYEKIIKETGKDFLINSAILPRAMLYNLVFSLKQAGNVLLNPHLTGFLIQYGFYIIIGGILIFCMFRSIYKLRSSRDIKQGRLFSFKDNPSSQFDNLFLIFSTGLTGISVNEVLIFFYQLKYGNLYLHIGLISALFMLGLCVGGIIIRRLLLHLNREPWYFLPFILVINLLLLTLIILFKTMDNPLFYILFFFACGMIAGCYVPIVTFRQKKKDISDQHSGALIELSDHLGATIGGLATGVILIPLAGAVATLTILCFLLGINLIFNLISFLALGKKIEKKGFKRFVRIIGYCCGGFCLFLVVVLLFYNTRTHSIEDTPFSRAVRILAREGELEQKDIQEAGNSKIVYYLIKGDDEKEERYIFSTEHFAPDISGYNGPIILAVMVTRSGELLNFIIIESVETPVYLDYVSSMLPLRLIGKNLFNHKSISEVDTVTGATATSSAIIQTLTVAGTGFAQHILGIEEGEKIPGRTHWFQMTGFIILLFLIIISLILRRFPSLWGRRIFLLMVIVLCGVIFNIQYSTDHLFRFGFLPFNRLTAISAILIIAIPLVSILCSNIYCGYLCPFGALQELIGDLRPPGLNTSPKKIIQFSRYIKYMLLFILAIASAAIMNPSIFLFDPLIGFFRFHGSFIAIIFWLFILVLSFFFPRLWCRNFCPAGAFLSIISKINPLRFLVHQIMPQYCDLGVQKNTDCICCDRCRISWHQKRMNIHTTTGKLKEWVFLFTIIFLICMLIAGQFLHTGKTRTAMDQNQKIITTESSAGKARDVNMKLIDNLIQKGQLSDHESEFYKKLELKKD